MQQVLNWIVNHPWLSALGSVASIVGLYLAIYKTRSQQTVQTVHAGGSIRRSAIKSSGSRVTDQRVTADEDIEDSPVTQSSDQSG